MLLGGVSYLTMTDLATNKTALYDYQILEKFEAGLVLAGHEVKAIRNKQISLKESYVTIRLSPKTKKPQAYLLNCHIARYRHAGQLVDYDPRRSRRLLLHQKQINSLAGTIQQKP